MKILFFSSYFYPYTSGVTTYPLKILTYLSKKNKITVLTFPFDKKSIKNCQLTIKRMPFLFRLSKGFISPQSLIYFYKYSKQSDLIILNQPNFEGVFLAIIGKLLNKRIISIFHCQVFLNGNIFTKIINYVLNISMKIQLHLSNKIIAYTKDYINSLPYFKKFLHKTVDILPPIEEITVDQRFLNQLIKLKKNNTWIGYAGRISNEKGIEYLVEAIHDIVIPAKAGIQIIFAGPYGKDVVGENDYYNKIVKMLKEYKINYFFLGNLTNKHLSAFYKSIDLLVLPSINQTEAFGMVQAEAMLIGTPVVASNLPGIRIPIKLTKMGKLVEPRNVKQLSQVINEVVKNRKNYSNKGLIKNAQKIFVIKKVYKFYESFINEKN